MLEISKALYRYISKNYKDIIMNNQQETLL